MPRRGRDLELLVELIETVIGGEGLKVQSPEYVQGRITGKAREVDVSLRTTVGSTDILVMIECRKRKEKPDAAWIEQIASKRQDVGASRVIAVSSTPFTAPAIKAAKHFDIDLRTVQELNASDVLSWLGLSEIGVTESKINLTSFHAMVAREHLSESVSGPDLALVDRRSGKGVSPKEVLKEHIGKAPPLPHAVTLGKSSLETDLRIPLQDGERFYSAIVDDKVIEVAGFTFYFRIDFNRFKVPLSGLSTYVAKGESLVETAEFFFQLGNQDFSFSFHRLVKAQGLVASLRALKTPNTRL